MESFDPQLSEAYVIRGRYYEGHNRNELAIKEYDKAIKFNPNDWRAYWSKGLLYFGHDFVKRIDNIEKAASLHRGLFLPELYREISMAYAHAGFKEKAIDNVKEVLKLDDDSAKYYCFLGEIEDCNGNFEKAIEFLKKSYAIFGVINGKFFCVIPVIANLTFNSSSNATTLHPNNPFCRLIGRRRTPPR